MNVTVFETGEEERFIEYLHGSLGGASVVIYYAGRDGKCHSDHVSIIDPIQLLPKENRQNEDTREKIEHTLIKMGFRQGQSGFYNIVEAMLLIAQTKYGQPILVTRDIYPKVAKQRGITCCSVERTIRNAIESVWKRSNLRTLREMYPYPCDNLNGRPTNAEFLINMAGEFRK